MNGWDVRGVDVPLAGRRSDLARVGGPLTPVDMSGWILPSIIVYVVGGARTLSVPIVLFVCVQDATMSQMGASLMRRLVGNSVNVRSAGTRPARAVNEVAARVVAEVGASMEGRVPRPLESAVLRRADKVVVLGSPAVVEPVSDMRATVLTWLTGNHRGPGLTDVDRLRLARDDLDQLVRDLSDELLEVSGPGWAARTPADSLSENDVVRVPRLLTRLEGAVAWVRDGYPSEYGPRGHISLAAVLPPRAVDRESTDPSSAGHTSS